MELSGTGAKVMLADGVCDIALMGVPCSLPLPPCDTASFVERLYVRGMNNVLQQIILLKVYDQQIYIKELRCKGLSHHVFLIVVYFLFLSFFPKSCSKNSRRRLGQMKISCFQTIFLY